MSKKNLFSYLLVILLSIALLSGCTKTEEISNQDIEEIIEDKNEEDIEIIDSENIEEVVKIEGVPSPISGIYVEESKTNKRPFAVMLDNQSKARPQAGLDQAEIVYEILAEGGITRYMAIFLTNEPETIGPVRSARPYYIDKAMEYNALYVHVGGSPQAFEDIKKLKIADIDAMSRDSSIFWRKSHKKIPHNMYTSTEAIRKAATNSKYDAEVEFQTMNFNENIEKIDGEELSLVEIPYYHNYLVEFRYDEEEKNYMRYINEKAHLDEISKIHLTATNILVQKVDSKIIDSVGRLDIDLVGRGEGYIITNGEFREVDWVKDSRRDITRFYYKDGSEITLNPGVTWIQVVPSDVTITTK